MAVLAIDAWCRLALTFREGPGTYQVRGGAGVTAGTGA
jgi:hypothetical protein